MRNQMAHWRSKIGVWIHLNAYKQRSIGERKTCLLTNLINREVKEGPSVIRIHHFASLQREYHIYIAHPISITTKIQVSDLVIVI